MTKQKEKSEEMALNVEITHRTINFNGVSTHKNTWKEMMQKKEPYNGTVVIEVWIWFHPFIFFLTNI